MTVIVGVDGSVGARAALEFAMDEAARRQSALRVIAVVQPPAYGFAAMSGFVPPSPRSSSRTSAECSPTTCRRHRHRTRRSRPACRSR